MILQLDLHRNTFILWVSILLLLSTSVIAKEGDSVFSAAKSSDLQLDNVVELRSLIVEKDYASDTIIDYLKKVKLRAIKIQDPNLLAEVSYDIGLVYFYNEEYIKSIEPLKRALENLTSLDFNDSLILYNNLTIAHTEIKAYNAAVEYVGSLETLMRQHPKEYAKLQTKITSLDGLYYNIGLYEDAIRVFNYRKSEELNLDRMDPYSYANDLFDFGRYFNANQQPDSALHYYQLARDIVESSNFENKAYFIGLIKGNIAEAFIQQDKYDEAIPLLKEDYVASLRAKDYLNSANKLNLLAYCEMKVNELDNALRHLQGVKELTTPEESPDIYYTNSLYLSQTFGALKQYDSAFYYARKHIIQTDSISSRRSLKRSANLSVSAELGHQSKIMESAIFQMEQEKRKAEQDRKYRDWILFGSALLAFLFIITLVSLWRQGKQKKRLQELITDYELKTNLVEKSLHEKEYLLKEIHHRVKNNLQIVSGILQLQSVYSKNKELKGIMQQSQTRIKSMALIHQMLYQNEDIRFIPFKSYLEKLSGQIISAMSVDMNKIKINIIIEEIQLDVEKAIPLGLIVNELLSNAIKHAYSPDENGVIDVWLKKSSQDTFTLIVSDDGVGMPKDFNFNQSETLGLQLVNMLTKQMRGTIQYNYNNGAEISINFKL